MMNKRRAYMEARRKSLIERFDADVSGDLDGMERQTLRSFLRERIRNGC